MGLIVLCADAASLQHPELIGLDGVDLEAMAWLACFSSSQEARSFVAASREVDEVWVVSSDEMSSLNLAGAMRRDDPGLPIYLVLFETTGSIMSRVKAVGANGVLSRMGLAQRFAQRNTQFEQEVAEAYAGVISEDFEEGRADDFGEGSGGSSKGHARDFAKALPGVTCGSVASTGDLHPVETGLGARNGYVMSVVSGSGGAGKSTVATLLAYCAQERGCKSVLVDCDLQFGDLQHLTGRDNAVTLDDVVQDDAAFAKLDEGLGCGSGQSAGMGPALVAAPRRLEDAEALARHLPQVIERLSSQFDFVVMNTGASWAEHHAVLLERSMCTLFLIDQRASSVRACKHALELCARCGIAAGSFAYALNRCASRAPLTSIDVSCALQGAHVTELKDGGPAVEELLGTGAVEELLVSRNELSQSVDALLDELLPRKTEAPGKAGGSGSANASASEVLRIGMFERVLRRKRAVKS